LSEIHGLITSNNPLHIAQAPGLLGELACEETTRIDALKTLTYLLDDEEHIRLRTLDVLRQLFEKADTKAYDGLGQMVGVALRDQAHRATAMHALRHGMTAPSPSCQSGVSRLLLRLMTGPPISPMAEQRAAFAFVTESARAKDPLIRSAFGELLGRTVLLVGGLRTGHRTRRGADPADWSWINYARYPSPKMWAGVMIGAAMYADDRQVRGRAALQVLSRLHQPGPEGDAVVDTLRALDFPTLITTACKKADATGNARHGPLASPLEEAWLRECGSLRRRSERLLAFDRDDPMTGGEVGTPS